MRSMWCLMIFYLLMLGVDGRAGEETPEPFSKERVAGLCKAFRDKGSFKATYDFQAPGNTGEFSIILNRRRNFCLSIFKNKEMDNPAIFAVDFPIQDDGSQIISIYQVDGLRGKYGTWTIEPRPGTMPSDYAGMIMYTMGLFHPSGINDRKKLTMSLSFDISAHECGISLSSDSQESAFQPTWLDTERLKKAETTIRGKEAIKYYFKDGRRLVISLSHGLPLSDQIHENEPAKKKSITLRAVENLDEARNQVDYIPRFKEVEFGTWQVHEYFEGIFKAMVVWQARKYGTYEDFEKRFEQIKLSSAEKIQKCAGRFAENLLSHADLKEPLNKFNMEFGKKLRKYYWDYKKNSKENLAYKTYGSFLDGMEAQVLKSRMSWSKALDLDILPTFPKTAEGWLNEAPEPGRARMKKVLEFFVLNFERGANDRIRAKIIKGVFDRERAIMTAKMAAAEKEWTERKKE